ncbi:MAG: hypothetical protein AAGJ96_08630 [Pseudomonadota bacterium]
MARAQEIVRGGAQRCLGLLVEGAEQGARVTSLGGKIRNPSWPLWAWRIRVSISSCTAAIFCDVVAAWVPGSVMQWSVEMR